MSTGRALPAAAIMLLLRAPAALLLAAPAALLLWVPAALLLAAPAASQGSLPASPPLPPVQGQSPPASPGGDDPLPPYEPQLERLSELMGTLTYLSGLCGRKEASEWRARMVALLDAEAKTRPRRERLAGAYNRGFTGYEATYRACTPSAEVVIARALAEGDRLSQELATRFGGS